MRSERNSDLGPFFEPRSVAVVGSVGEGRVGGYQVIENMLHFGFAGDIYPINPSATEVLGRQVYATVNQVDEPIDLAIVITPPPTVPAIIGQCARKGVKAVIILSEGFAEEGEAGAALQEQVVDIARSGDVRVMGPNTTGVVCTSSGLVTAPYRIGYDRIWGGNITYTSQSGFVGAPAQPLEQRTYHVSKMCDLGNKCDVDEVDLLDYLISDPETEVIAMHLEAVADGRRFMDALRGAVPCKPVLIFKTGRSEEGAKASASHTGSMLGSGQVYDKLFKQAGAIQIRTWQEFWDLPKVFAYQPLPKGNRIAIITPTGGVGVAAVDAAVESGLAIARLSDVTVERLAKLSPRLTKNPVDLGPVSVVSGANPIVMLDSAINAVLDDPNVDCAAIVLYVGVMLSAQATVDIFDRLRQHISKPVAITLYGPDLFAREELARQLEALGLPTYLELEMAIKALGVAAGYAKFKSDVDHQAA